MISWIIARSSGWSARSNTAHALDGRRCPRRAGELPGGRFITCTDNPEFTLSKPNCTKYGVTLLRQEPEEDRYACEAEFAANPPFRVRWYQWNQATYEWALQEAGFRDFAWYPSEVSQEDVVRYGEAYWHDFFDNCPTIGLVCQK